MTALNKHAQLRKELSNPAIGSNHHLRKLALALLDENLQLQRDKDSLEAAALAMRDDMREAREKLEAAEKRLAELEARTVCLPKLPVLGSTAEWYEGFAAGASGMRNECADAIRAAGIGVKGE
nr:ead/Ea22-like family protein [Citrobacter freundii]